MNRNPRVGTNIKTAESDEGSTHEIENAAFCLFRMGFIKLYLKNPCETKTLNGN